MILKHYGLREQPFGVAPNPRFIYQGPGHREALASLIYAIESNVGFAALIGQAGLGKTTLVFHLLDYFRQSARTAVVFNTQCNKGELLRYILAEFGETQLSSDVVVLYEHFRDILAREASQGRRVIIIIDEAQNLELEALEAVRLLNNFETSECKLLHIILVGQQQLAAKLVHPAMEQLLQRITIICRLTKFEDTASIERYIDHRLRTAGYDKTTPLFNANAIAAILRKSDGVPRKINRLCFNALLIGCVLNEVEIDDAIIEEVSRDLDLGELAPGETSIATKAGAAPNAKVSAPGSLPTTLYEMPATTQPLTQPLPIAIGSLATMDYAVPIEAETAARISRPPIPSAAVDVSPVQEQRPLRADLVSDDIRNRAPLPHCAAVPAGVADAIRPAAGRKIPSTSAAPTPIKKRESPNWEPRSIWKIMLVPALSFATLALGAWFLTSAPVPRAHQPQSSQLSAQEAPTQATQAQSAQEATTQATQAQSVQEAPTQEPQVQQEQTGIPLQIPEAPTVKSTPSKVLQRKAISVDRNDEDVSIAFNIWPEDYRFGSTFRNSGPLPAAQQLAAGRPLNFVGHVMPTYPTDAEASKIQGKVVLRALVGRDGRVSSVLSSQGPELLASAAASAVQNWTFPPVIRDGRSISTVKELIFNFNLPAERGIAHSQTARSPSR